MRDAYAGSLHLLFALCLAVAIDCLLQYSEPAPRYEGLSRRPYVALQLALGASRRRIIRQALTESSILAPAR